jgi:hypothetical protein
MKGYIFQELLIALSQIMSDHVPPFPSYTSERF